MPVTPIEQARAELRAAYERRARLIERMQDGVSQVTHADGSGIRYESSSEQIKALAIAEAEIARLERLLRPGRRPGRYFYPAVGRGI